MKYSDLIDNIAETNGITKVDARAAVERVFGAISASLTKGEEVRVNNFGTFVVKDVAAKTARNPLTGATINVPAKKVARFKIAKPLADAVKG